MTTKHEKGKYDLNEDGIVNKQDRSILKANYGKTNTKEQWVNPNPPAQTTASSNSNTLNTAINISSIRM